MGIHIVLWICRHRRLFFFLYLHARMFKLTPYPSIKRVVYHNHRQQLTPTSWPWEEAMCLSTHCHPHIDLYRFCPSIIRGITSEERNCRSLPPKDQDHHPQISNMAWRYVMHARLRPPRVHPSQPLGEFFGFRLACTNWGGSYFLFTFQHKRRRTIPTIIFFFLCCENDFTSDTWRSTCDMPTFH